MENGKLNNAASSSVKTDGEAVSFCLVPISRGQFVMVSPCDTDRVLAHSWTLFPQRNTSYAKASIGGKTTYLHRFIMDAPKGVQVDHIDSNGLNNTRQNLRLVTASQNHQNRRKQIGTTSPYKGVTTHRSTGKWRAQIKINGFFKHIGLFATLEEAARAYDRKAVELFGPFARLNYPLPRPLVRDLATAGEGIFIPQQQEVA